MPSIKSFVVIFAAFLGNSVCAASVPRLMNLQGRLTDKSGIPLSGAYEIRFSVWDSALGGGMLRDEKQKISDLAVTQTKLADKSVTPAKLSDDALYTDDKAVSQIFRLFPSNRGAPITLNFAPAPNSSLRSSEMRRRHNPQN